MYFDFRHHHDLPETYRASRFSSHYASSKYAAEQVLHECIAHYPDTTYVILRPRGLFGPHDRVIVPRLLQQLSRIAMCCVYREEGKRSLISRLC